MIGFDRESEEETTLSLSPTQQATIENILPDQSGILS
jgi:hypothetical protein